MLTLPAPAKINLFLHVLRRRGDGYHDVRTLFQFLDFGDTLVFEAIDQPDIQRIDRHGFALPVEDLIIRAAKLLRAAYPQAAARGTVITVHKRIPPGSGLGGGSSCAATTLLALNRLWRLGASVPQLAELGRQLGADVPVFIRGRAALASGIGATLTPCNPPQCWLCLAVPPVQVSTAEVFAHPALRCDASRPAAAGAADNDLAPVAALLHPEVGAALAALGAHGEARMSGSGGAVYARFATRQQAGIAAAGLPASLNAFVTRSRNRHPLASRWR